MVLGLLGIVENYGDVVGFGGEDLVFHEAENGPDYHEKRNFGVLVAAEHGLAAVY